MRHHVLWRLIWIQTVCKGLQNSVPALKELSHVIHNDNVQVYDERTTVYGLCDAAVTHSLKHP
ncbi:hypothetical protein DPMN_105111 [Dreissena polymorpha]|uniref:Uncharacterized protein n=1 Tax=Dreissena polymorpha TaxID=45954 RepID=A0A9D4HE98_DREPO|nr:hypothetical protein DPMN_105111 [Dreissena polymorpha]